MKKLLIYCVLIINALMIDACQKPIEIDNAGSTGSLRQGSDVSRINVDLSVKGDYQVHDGILFFKSVDTFTALDQKMRSLSPEKRVEFTRELGFTSLLDGQLATYNSLSKAESKDEYERILFNNKDIILQKNDEQPELLFEEVSSALLSREGIVGIGGVVHCFAKDRTVIATDVKKVRQTYKMGKKVDASVTVIEKRGKANARVGATCLQFDQTVENNGGNRRVNCIVTINQRYIQTGSAPYPLYQLDYYAYVQGIPTKKNFWGNWVNYSSGNTIQSRFSVYISTREPDQWGFPSYPNYYLAVDDTRSNDGSFIDYAPIIKSHYNIVDYYVQTDSYAILSRSLTEGNPLGVYTSGGVPTGVQMKCQ